MHDNKQQKTTINFKFECFEFIIHVVPVKNEAPKVQTLSATIHY